MKKFRKGVISVNDVMFLLFIMYCIKKNVFLFMVMVIILVIIVLVFCFVVISRVFLLSEIKYIVLYDVIIKD